MELENNVADVEEVVDNVDVNTDVEDTGDNETEVVEVKAEPEKFRPWKTKQPELIPYDRFKAVTEEKNHAASRIAQLEAEINNLKSKEIDPKELKALKDIKVTDYNDPEEFLRDRDAALAREIEQRYIAREQQKLEAQKQQVMIDSYQKTISEAITRDPEIKDATDFFHSIAPNINDAIIYELINDENAGELIYDITTNQELLNEMFTGNPADVIRKIHKMSGKIDRDARYGNKSTQATTSSSQSVQIPKALPKSGIPTKIKTHGSSPAKDPSKMSLAAYRAFVENGYK